MLDRMVPVARRFFEWRRPLWIAAGVSLVGATAAVLTGASGDRVVLPLLMLFLWLMFLLGLAYTFAAVPPAPPPDASLVARLKTRLLRLLLWLMLLVAAALLLLVVYVSSRAFGILF